MFNNENTRQQAIMHAARGHEGSMRQVLADICERLDALEAGSIDLSDIYERLAALEAGTAPPCRPREESEVPLDERIKIAIRALPMDQYGANGKPHVTAIETALGESITAADRDRVWAAMQEDA